MTAPKPKLLRAVHANRGVEVKYRKSLDKLIADMIASVDREIRTAYRRDPPSMVELVEVAEDASPSREIQRVLSELGRRWIKRFNDAADRLAEMFTTSGMRATDSALRSALRDAGWTVEFRMSAPMRDAMAATIEENVGLIRSIPQQYLTDVQGIVMRSYARGRDLETMTRELRQRYGVTERRAALIARDQSNKLNAVVNRARQMELGITEAVWMHSGGGKEPRPDHVAANGKRYKIAEGRLISGEYVQPGEKINCRCTSRAVLPI